MTDGGWFHARVERVSRSDGKSAVGLVAYVTGQQLKDEETGVWCKRNHAGEVLGWGTEAPFRSPAYLTDPAHLAEAWNNAQRAETRKNSHLANHENLALSAKFGEEDHIAVMRTIAGCMVERYGVMVTWAVHKPPEHGDQRNWHGHLAYNMRRITPTGFGEKAREIIDKPTRSDERLWQRQMFADVINDRLAQLGHDERVTPLSFEERGIVREPTKHLGNKQNQAELRGIRTPTGEENRAIRERNAEYDKEQELNITEARQLHHEAQVIDLLAERLKRLDKETQMSDHPEDKRRKEADYQLAAEVAALKTAEFQQQRADEFIRNIDDRSKRAREEQEKLAQDAKRQADAGDITDARNRYAQASTAFDIRRPYSSLCDVAAAENAAYHRGQDDLTKAAATEKDPDKRRLILMRRDIEHADYMQITTERLAGMSYVVTGRRDYGSQFQRDSDAAREWNERGRALREERSDLQQEINDRGMEDISRQIHDLERGVKGQMLGNGQYAVRKKEERDEDRTQPQPESEEARKERWRVEYRDAEARATDPGRMRGGGMSR